MALFIVQDPSTRQLRLMKRLHDLLPAALSLLVPSAGHAKATASNLAPGRTQLMEVFFKDAHLGPDGALLPAAADADGASAAAAGGAARRTEFYIAEQVCTHLPRWTCGCPRYRVHPLSATPD